MSTAQGDERCPRCGGVMWYDFDCSTMEELRRCDRCGFFQEWSLKRDKDGKVISNGDHPYGIGQYLQGGVGIVVTTGFDGCGISEVLVSMPRFKELKRQVKEWKRDPYIDEDQCYIGLWDRKHKKTRVFFGKKQPDYDDFEKIEIGNLYAAVSEVPAQQAEEDSDLPF